MKKIMVCNLFNENSGSFVTIDNNIALETINFFRDDEGNVNIFIPPLGKIDEDFLNSSNGIDYLLITMGCGKNTVKVIYRIDEPVFYGKDVGGNIRYGGVTLEEIFENNSAGQDRYVTFRAKAENVFCPAEEILIVSGINGETAIKKKLRNQSMRTYFGEGAEKKDKNGTYTKKDMKNDHKMLSDILKKSDKWRQADLLIADINDISMFEEKINESFIDIIGKDYDELAYSNMFAYFFRKYSELFQDFAKAVLKIDIATSKGFSVRREKDNIDLYIVCGEKHIIIENKILSGITESKKEAEENKSKTKDKISQLSCYYKSLEDNKINKEKISCYIFCPQYKVAQIEEDKKKYLYGEEYRVISYRDIYDFYKDISKNIDDDFLDLFLSSLEKHIKDIDTNIEDIMKLRFLKRIKELN